MRTVALLVLSSAAMASAFAPAAAPALRAATVSVRMAAADDEKARREAQQAAKRSEVKTVDYLTQFASKGPSKATSGQDGKYNRLVIWK